MPNNTSPANDGFFRLFWNDICTFLVKSIHYAYSIGELSVTHKQRIITCITKGNKDKLYLTNGDQFCLQNCFSINCFLSEKYTKNVINGDPTEFLQGTSNVIKYWNVI